jgi:excinuclease ABC subunit C
LGEENAHQYLQTLSNRAEIEEVKLLNALKTLQKNLSLDHLPARIEAYDISNLQGKNAVGSMIVFDYARPKKQGYRKFKIRTKDTPDDFAMMREMLTRRFKHSSSDSNHWPMPDLILIDGGKGQLSAALQALRTSGLKLHVPVIGLAKRLEEIFIPGKRRPILLPANSPSLFLLQRIRDEAHRFAITFHRKLRLKKLTESQLDEIPGIGDVKKKILLQKFGSIRNIKNAGLTEISAVSGRLLAKKIKALL